MLADRDAHMNGMTVNTMLSEISSGNIKRFSFTEQKLKPFVSPNQASSQTQIRYEMLS